MELLSLDLRYDSSEEIVRAANPSVIGVKGNVSEQHAQTVFQLLALPNMLVTVC